VERAGLEPATLMKFKSKVNIKWDKRAVQKVQDNAMQNDRIARQGQAEHDAVRDARRDAEPCCRRWGGWEIHACCPSASCPAT
jgi:hypothetical protein